MQKKVSKSANIKILSYYDIVIHTYPKTGLLVYNVNLVEFEHQYYLSDYEIIIHEY
jgi:hypothetical protein